MKYSWHTFAFSLFAFLFLTRSSFASEFTKITCKTFYVPEDRVDPNSEFYCQETPSVGAPCVVTCKGETYVEYSNSVGIAVVKIPKEKCDIGDNYVIHSEIYACRWDHSVYEPTYNSLPSNEITASIGSSPQDSIPQVPEFNLINAGLALLGSGIVYLKKRT